MANYSRSIRIPLALKDTIVAKKGNKSMNQYIKEQLLGNNNFSQDDYLSLKNYIDKNLKKSGNKINSFAKKLNTYEVTEIDFIIIDYIEKYIFDLESIKKKKIKTIEFKNNVSNNALKCYSLRLTLSDLNKDILFKKIKESGLSASDYIRQTLFNASEYSCFDFQILFKRLHQNVYRTINNIRQIIFQYFNLDNSSGLINDLEKKINEIKNIERDIMVKMEEYYGYY